MTTFEFSIDLGSKFITIVQHERGGSSRLVLREPAIAIVTKAHNRLEIRDAGFRAQNVMTGSLGGAKVIEPIREGVIVDEEMATKLLAYFLEKITPKSIFKPHVNAIVSICSSSTGSDRQAVEKCCLKAGISEVTLVEAPLSLLSYTNSIGGLFVDIGGGKTEIAAVTNHGIAAGCTVNIAGDAFNKAIIDYIFERYGVRLGEFTVEHLKQSALSFYIGDEGSYAVSGGGRDGNPKSVFVTADDLRNAVIDIVDDVIEVIISVIDQAPPELSAEILRKGIFISGGSLRIPGLKDYMEQALELPITVLEDLETAVAKGGANFFDNKELLSDMLGVKLL